VSGVHLADIEIEEGKFYTELTTSRLILTPITELIFRRRVVSCVHLADIEVEK
jgi:hypothetical protein